MSNLERGDAGYRQILAVDSWCMSRANEAWAIIPDILRIGHDVDPIECVHWRPDPTNIPSELATYYDEQSDTCEFSQSRGVRRYGNEHAAFRFQLHGLESLPGEYTVS